MQLGLLRLQEILAELSIISHNISAIVTHPFLTSLPKIKAAYCSKNIKFPILHPTSFPLCLAQQTRFARLVKLARLSLFRSPRQDPLGCQVKFTLLTLSSFHCHLRHHQPPPYPPPNSSFLFRPSTQVSDKSAQTTEKQPQLHSSSRPGWQTWALPGGKVSIPST